MPNAAEADEQQNRNRDQSQSRRFQHVGLRLPHLVVFQDRNTSQGNMNRFVVGVLSVDGGHVFAKPINAGGHASEVRFLLNRKHLHEAQSARVVHRVDNVAGLRAHILIDTHGVRPRWAERCLVNLKVVGHMVVKPRHAGC